jgi:ABC-type transporter Mla subunit MlaD
MKSLSGEVSKLRTQTVEMLFAFAVLQNKLTQLSTNFGRLAGEFSTLRSAAAEIGTLSGDVSALKRQISAVLRDPVVQQLSMDLSELRKEVLALKCQIAAVPPTAVPFIPKRPPPPSPTAVKFAPQQSSIPSAPSIDSRIISDFPEIFTEF